MSWSLYLLRTSSGMLYTGITTDVARRVAQHQAGILRVVALQGISSEVIPHLDPVRSLTGRGIAKAEPD